MRLTPAASIRYTLHICRELIFLKNCKWEGKCIQLVRGHTECQLQESKYVCKGNLTKNTSFESTELLMCTMLQDIYSADDTGPRLIIVKKKQLLFYTPVTCSLPLLPLVSPLLLMLLVLWSQSSFLTSVHRGDIMLPKVCLLPKWDNFGRLLVNVGGLACTFETATEFYAQAKVRHVHSTIN